MKNLDTKKHLWNLVDQNKDELLNLCSQLIRNPSINPPVQADAVTQCITEYLDRNHVAYRFVKNNPGMPIIVAQVGRGGGKTLGFNGHTDVVPPGDPSKWEFDPHCGTITDTQVLGRGASDMLCGVAIEMFLCAIIARYDLPLQGRIVMHIVSDEESGGQYCSKYLVDSGYAKNLDALILAEPTTWNNVETGSKGSLRMVVKSYGTQAHGSVCSWVGDNAVAKLVALLNRIPEMADMKASFDPDQLPVVANAKRVAEDILKVPGVGEAIDHVTYNIRSIASGRDAASSEYAEAHISFGIPVGITVANVKETFEDLIRTSGYSGIEVEYSRSWESSHTPASSPLVRIALENACGVWDRQVVPVYQWATSDGRWYRYADIPAIQYGPANIDGVHGYNESADIEDIMNCCKTYFGIVTDFVGFGTL